MPKTIIGEGCIPLTEEPSQNTGIRLSELVPISDTPPAKMALQGAEPKDDSTPTTQHPIHQNIRPNEDEARTVSPNRTRCVSVTGGATRPRTQTENISISAEPNPCTPTGAETTPPKAQPTPRKEVLTPGDTTKLQACVQSGIAADNAIKKRKERIATLMDNMKATEKWETIDGIAAFRSKVQKQPSVKPGSTPAPAVPTVPKSNPTKTKTAKQSSTARHIPIDQMLARYRTTTTKALEESTPRTTESPPTELDVDPGTKEPDHELAAHLQPQSGESLSAPMKDKHTHGLGSPVQTTVQCINNEPLPEVVSGPAEEGKGKEVETKAHEATTCRDPTQFSQCLEKWEHATSNAVTMSIPSSSQEDAYIPLVELKEREARKQQAQELTQESEQSVPQTPLMATMSARKNDMTQSEQAYVRSLTSEKGGHSRFDYVPPEARFIYRCPLKGCPNPHSTKGLPISSDGLRGKYHRHLARDHQDIETSINLRVKMRDGTEQFSEYPRPKKHIPRKRYRLPQQTTEITRRCEQKTSMEAREEYPTRDETGSPIGKQRKYVCPPTSAPQSEHALSDATLQEGYNESDANLPAPSAIARHTNDDTSAMGIQTQQDQGLLSTSHFHPQEQQSETPQCASLGTSRCPSKPIQPLLRYTGTHDQDGTEIAEELNPSDDLDPSADPMPQGEDNESKQSGFEPSATPQAVSQQTSEAASIDLTQDEEEDEIVETGETKARDEAAPHTVPTSTSHETSVQFDDPSDKNTHDEPEDVKFGPPVERTPSGSVTDPQDPPVPNLQDIMAAYGAQNPPLTQNPTQPTFPPCDPTLIPPTYQGEPFQIPSTPTTKPAPLHEDHPMRGQMTINPDTMALSAPKEPGFSEEEDGQQVAAHHTTHFPRNTPTTTDNKTAKMAPSPKTAGKGSVAEQGSLHPDGEEARPDPEDDDDDDDDAQGSNFSPQKGSEAL